MTGSPTLFQAASAAPPGKPGGAPPMLAPAVLQILQPPESGSNDALPKETGQEIKFQFNPKELTLTKTAKWGENTKPGAKKTGVQQYLGPEPAKLSVEMFLDASRTMDGSVIKAVETLFSCCVPAKGTAEKQKPTPPWVRFQWGSITGFAAHIKSVSVKYTLFTSEGMPIRAVCTVQMEEMGSETKGQNPTSGGLASRSVHTMIDGDSLPSVAYAEYGDPTLWRALAEANDIDDPMRLPPGRPLLVPALEELNGHAGA